LIFAGYTGSKNQVLNKLKIEDISREISVAQLVKIKNTPSEIISPHFSKVSTEQ
jgi:hypothetical protein